MSRTGPELDRLIAAKRTMIATLERNAEISARRAEDALAAGEDGLATELDRERGFLGETLRIEQQNLAGYLHQRAALEAKAPPAQGGEE